MEAELAALRKLAEALADRQESLIQQTKGLEEGESTEARETESVQRRLAGDTDTLTEQVADAAEHAQEVSRQLAGSLDSLTAQLMGADPSGQMRQAASALKRGSPSAAGQPQHGALETLRNAAALLAEMEAQLTGELRSQLTRAAAELVRDCLHVSQRQEELLGATERLAGSGTPDLLRDKQRISPLRRRQDLLASAVQNLARRLTDLARQTPLVDPSFGRDMAAIANSMSQASRELEGAALSQAWERQRASLADLNEAAQRLLELGDKMSQASAQMALSEYLKRLQALAQRQQGLNAQTEQAAQGGQRPSADGMPSLAGLAAEQALIRAALEQMMRAAGGEAKQVADQLGGTPGEMEKVEGDLKAGRLTKETRERQTNILQRMLDAQRSLYTKSPERSQRKAEHARRYQPAPSPPPLSPSLLRAPSIKAPQASSGDALPAGFEDLVREYYRRLGQ